jgi:hypothetical protein
VPPTEPPTLPTAALALAVTAAIALATTAAPLATAAAAQPAAAIIPPALAATAAAAIALAAAAVAQPTAATTQPAVAATAITAVALANAAGSQPAAPIVAIAAPTTTAVALPAAAIALTVLTPTVAAACRLQELQPALSLRSLRWNYRPAAHHTHTPRFGLGATLTLTLSSRTIYPILLEVSAAPTHPVRRKAVQTRRQLDRSWMADLAIAVHLLQDPWAPNGTRTGTLSTDAITHCNAATRNGQRVRPGTDGSGQDGSRPRRHAHSTCSSTISRWAAHAWL